MMSDKEIKTFVEENIFPILETGDPLWDKPHAQAAGFHMGNIIDSLKSNAIIDRTVLLISAYSHDIGYSKYYRKDRSLTKEEYMQAKKTHAQIGVEMLRPLLESLDLSLDQKNRILHLVLVHDDVEEHEVFEEVLLMEADTLAGLDVNFVTPTFKKEKYFSLLESIKRKRRSRFQTDYSIDLFDVLVAKRLEFYDTELPTS